MLLLQVLIVIRSSCERTGAQLLDTLRKQLITKWRLRSLPTPTSQWGSFLKITPCNFYCYITNVEKFFKFFLFNCKFGDRKEINTCRSYWMSSSIFKQFLEDVSPFGGPLLPLFWISGYISSGFQSRSRQFTLGRIIHIACSFDWPLVWHLLTSWWTAWYLRHSLLHRWGQKLVGLETGTYRATSHSVISCWISFFCIAKIKGSNFAEE